MKVGVCSDLGVRGLPGGSETRWASQDSALHPKSNRKPLQCFEQRSGMPEWVLSQVPAGEGLVLWGYGGAQGQSYKRDGGRQRHREGGRGWVSGSYYRCAKGNSSG